MNIVWGVRRCPVSVGFGTNLLMLSATTAHQKTLLELKVKLIENISKEW